MPPSNKYQSVPKSPSSPSPLQAAGAAVGLDGGVTGGGASSPFSVLGETSRAQAGFLTLTLGIMFVMLLLYRPGQQEGLLCGSNQAQRQRMTYDLEARTMADIERIQMMKRLYAQQQNQPYTSQPYTSPNLQSNDGSDRTVRFISVASTNHQSQLWDRKEFTAPPPAEPLKLIDGRPRPPPTELSTEQARKYESEFQSVLHSHGGDVMEAFRSWISPAVDKLEVRAAPLHTVDQALVMLDGRQDPMAIFILKHTLHLLGPGWALVIFHTQENEAWFIDQLKIRPGEPGEHIQLQRVQPIGKAQANSLAMSTVFHERIGVETILLVQPDAFMLRSPYLGTPEDRTAWNTLLSKFGFIGAPWGWCKEDWCKYGGNGGVSLRKSSVMRDVMSELRCGDWECHRYDLFRDQEHNPDAWWRTEDTFVAKVLHLHQRRWEGRLPNQMESAEFSLEHLEVNHVKPFFVHKIWRYQPQTRWLPLLAHVRQYYPEL